MGFVAVTFRWVGWLMLCGDVLYTKRMRSDKSGRAFRKRFSLISITDINSRETETVARVQGSGEQTVFSVKGKIFQKVCANNNRRKKKYWKYGADYVNCVRRWVECFLLCVLITSIHRQIMERGLLLRLIKCFNNFYIKFSCDKRESTAVTVRSSLSYQANVF